MYYEFIREIMLYLKMIKKDFKYGMDTPLNHNEAVLLYFLMTTGSPYFLAEILDQDPAQIYRSLKKLEESNLVVKERLEKKAKYLSQVRGRSWWNFLKMG